ncbi:replication initiation protein [Alces alces faeces associated microvirus MP18 4940]|uniref:replication initiation protein n=1 Tax=Alces alces faeces associated microvirus MP18 4940 TaxID=2219137 RepID=UPI000DF08F77|nr:replication initiation protein [Alces alces faeces associated microvirus MP18 4940]AXB22586.1 replication initiation protein [Alces alces faeces associated microvirus MP18 4940]
MPCYHPLKAFKVGITKNNKDKLLITSYKVDHLEYNNRLNKFDRVYSSDLVNPYADKVISCFDIPCGHCIGCRLDYSRNWACRMLLEVEEHSESWFCTFTYDNAHIPTSVGYDVDSGEMFPTVTLRKRDWQLFMKRLRKWFDSVYPGEKLKYFAAGEYGDTTFRPHIHAIIFGLHLPDLRPSDRFFSRDFQYYESDILSSIWNMGHVVVANVTFETCAYTARYIVKKLNGKQADLYDQLGIEREWALMSRKPGIGSAYADRNIEHLLDDKYLIISTEDGGKKFPVPNYYKRKFDSWFDSQDMVESSWYKFDRSQAAIRVMESIKQQQLSNTDLSYIDLLAVNEAAQQAKMKGLERKV